MIGTPGFEAFAGSQGTGPRVSCVPAHVDAPRRTQLVATNITKTQSRLGCAAGRRYCHLVAIKRGSRDVEGIGSLKLLAAFDLPATGVIAGGRDGVSELMERLAGGARASLENPSRLHGLRTEAMFRAVLVALGSFHLLVEEDEGRIYYDDALGPVKLPDYFAVDAEGRRLLIEVKAVPPATPASPAAAEPPRPMA